MPRQRKRAGASASQIVTAPATTPMTPTARHTLDRVGAARGLGQIEQADAEDEQRRGDSDGRPRDGGRGWPALVAVRRPSRPERQPPARSGRCRDPASPPRTRRSRRSPTIHSHSSVRTRRHPRRLAVRAPLAPPGDGRRDKIERPRERIAEDDREVEQSGPRCTCTPSPR